jgi:ABC transporter substrate binding protein
VAVGRVWTGPHVNASCDWLDAAAPIDKIASYRALRMGLEQNGLVIGGNLAFEMRSADGQRDHLPAIIAAVVADKPDVIFTWGTEPVQAVLAQTQSVPVVMASIGNPIGAGVVSNPAEMLLVLVCFAGDNWKASATAKANAAAPPSRNVPSESGQQKR